MDAPASTNSRALTEREKRFFTSYLAALDSASIPHALLRNYEEFPARIGQDVDLFIRRHDLAAAQAILRDTLRVSGGRMIVVNARDYVCDLRFVIGSESGPLLHLDLYHGAYTWHGWSLLPDDRLIAGARPRDFFRIPRPAHEAFGLVLSSLLWGGFFKARYQPRIAALLSEVAEAEEFDRCLHWAFGSAKALPFDPCSPTPPDAALVGLTVRRLRAALCREAFRRGPIRAIGDWLGHWIGEARTFLRPVGLHIALLGPDGSGKSTVMAECERRLRPYFVEVHLHHWRPGVLPDFGVLLGRREASSEPVADPHGRPPHSAPASIIRLGYYLLDYWLGFFPRIWRRKAQKHLVLFDRYAADMACDPWRYRLGLPEWLLRMACALTPQPDFTWVLLADAATLRARKNELPAERVTELLSRYRRAAPRPGDVLDASRPVEELLDEIERRVVERLRQKLPTAWREPGS